MMHLLVMEQGDDEAGTMVTREATATLAPERAEATPRRTWWEGALATLPMWPGAVLFAIVYAVTARAAGLTAPEIVGMSVLVFGGAAQFAAVNLIAGGAGALAVIAGTAIANARYILVSASIAPHVARKPRGWRCLYAFHLSDESYALAMARFLHGDGTAAYALGANLGMTLPWIGASVAGVLLGAALPAPSRWGIDLVIPLTFLGLLVPLLKTRRAVGVALCSGALALVGITILPGTWYLLIAGIGGSAIGALWRAWEERRICG
jgi:4-azaleucine resistance transporter AzlC